MAVSLKSAVRDFVVNMLPIEQMNPKWIMRWYHYDVSFVFLTHPRDSHDLYNSFPLLIHLKKWVPEHWIRKLLSFCPCFVASHVQTKEGLHGFFISTSIFPEELFNNRDATLKNAMRIVKFIRKITSKRVFVGLAAWWPIVTNGGAAFQRFLKVGDRVVVTNGHCATLASIFLSVLGIGKICALPLKKLKLLIIGVGRMGGSVAEIFNGQVDTIGLVDENTVRLDRMKAVLGEGTSVSHIERVQVTKTNFSKIILSTLPSYHVAVCTTSNVGYVIENIAELRDAVIIDDARPEAFPRVFDARRNLVILEGGLMKIAGIEFDTNFGFGTKENVFGCLTEAYLLALDQLHTLVPTIGEVDRGNFHKLLQLCKKFEICEGDFLCGEQVVSDVSIRGIMNDKLKRIGA